MEGFVYFCFVLKCCIVLWTLGSGGQKPRDSLRGLGGAKAPRQTWLSRFVVSFPVVLFLSLPHFLPFLALLCSFLFLMWRFHNGIYVWCRVFVVEPLCRHIVVSVCFRWTVSLFCLFCVPWGLGFKCGVWGARAPRQSYPSRFVVSFRGFCFTKGPRKLGTSTGRLAPSAAASHVPHGQLSVKAS